MCISIKVIYREVGVDTLKVCQHAPPPPPTPTTNIVNNNLMDGFALELSTKLEASKNFTAEIQQQITGTGTTTSGRS